MHKTKLVLGALVALIVAAMGGWLWGTLGNRDLSRSLDASLVRNDLLGAYTSVLEARLEIYSINFGEASKHLENARAQLGRAGEELNTLGRQDDAVRLGPALERIDEAQQLAGKLDQSANARSAEAATIIHDVLETSVKR
jgi:hypothetical protein